MARRRRVRTALLNQFFLPKYVTLVCLYRTASNLILSRYLRPQLHAANTSIHVMFTFISNPNLMHISNGRKLVPGACRLVRDYNLDTRKCGRKL